jgi:hypothetical protein
LTLKRPPHDERVIAGTQNIATFELFFSGYIFYTNGLVMKDAKLIFFILNTEELFSSICYFSVNSPADRRCYPDLFHFQHERTFFINLLFFSQFVS